MKKIEMDGEIYYYNNGVYLDNQFIEVDETTKEKINVKINNQETISKVIKNDTDKRITYYNKNYRNKGSVSQLMQYHARKLEISLNTKPKLTQSNHHSRSKLDYDLTTKAIDYKDYGLTEIDFKNYEKSLQDFENAKKDIYAKNILNDKKSDKIVRNTLIIYVVTLLVLVFLIGNEPTIGSAIFCFILSFVVPAIYYKVSMSSCEKEAEPDKYSFVDNELENRINTYKNDKIRYDAELRRTTIQFWENLTPFQFEREVAELFKSLGASAYTTPKVNDGGMDVVMKYKNRSYAVECKHHQSPVGPAMVDRLRGVLSKEIPNGIFVSLNGYTFEAKKRNSESRTPILLLDKHKLVQLAKSKDISIYI